MKHFIFIFSGLLAFACSTPAPPTQSEPVVTQSDSLPSDPGKHIFEEKCVICHGFDGTAGVAHAADLQVSRIDSLLVIRIVTDGKNAMPSFNSQLSTAEIEQVAAYIHSLRK